jgi:hypothetical protein
MIYVGEHNSTTCLENETWSNPLPNCFGTSFVILMINYYKLLKVINYWMHELLIEVKINLMIDIFYWIIWKLRALCPNSITVESTFSRLVKKYLTDKLLKLIVSHNMNCITTQLMPFVITARGLMCLNVFRVWFYYQNNYILL